MYSVDLAGASAPESLWARIAAREAVSAAIAHLDDVGAGLLPLRAQSDWQAEGVRALHVLLDDLSARVGAEVGRLQARLWEIDALEER